MKKLLIGLILLTSIPVSAISITNVKVDDTLIVYTDENITVNLREELPNDFAFTFVDDISTFLGKNLTPKLISRLKVGSTFRVLELKSIAAGKVWARVTTDQKIEGWVYIGIENRNLRSYLFNKSYLERLEI